MPSFFPSKYFRSHFVGFFSVNVTFQVGTFAFIKEHLRNICHNIKFCEYFISFKIYLFIVKRTAA